MFVRIELKNWRSIDDAQIDLAPFTVLVGRNSSGKSNVVDALVFADEVGRDAATAVSRRGGIESIRRWSHSKPFAVTIRLTVAKSAEGVDADRLTHLMVLKSGKEGEWSFSKEEIEVFHGGKRIASLARSSGTTTVDLPTGRQQLFEVGDFPSTTSLMLLARQVGAFPARQSIRPPRVHRLRPVPELMREPHPPTESSRLTETAGNIATVLNRMDAAEKASVLAAMKQIVPGLIDIQANPAGRYVTLGFTQEHLADRRPEFLATEMSDGALRALAVVVAAQQMTRNELLVIEEPEVNLHPGAANVVYDVLHAASERGLVLITTHSPELLDRARDDEIQVCQYEDGVTKIGPLSSAQRDLVRQGLFSVAELMRADELRREGAPPRVVPD